MMGCLELVFFVATTAPCRAISALFDLPNPSRIHFGLVSADVDLVRGNHRMTQITDLKQRFEGIEKKEMESSQTKCLKVRRACGFVIAGWFPETPSVSLFRPFSGNV